MGKKKGGKSKRAQTWSVDLIVGVVVFLLVVVVLFSILSTEQDEETMLRQEADRIYSTLDQRATPPQEPDQLTPFVAGHSISQNELEIIFKEDYDDIKQQIGIRGDFCIVLVDQDNRILTFEGKTSVGKGQDGLAPRITDTGIVCGGAAPT